MTKAALKEVRDLLALTVRDLAETGRSSRDIATEFRRRHPAVVAANSEALIATALVKLVGDVSGRKSRPSLVPGQGDLFAAYSIPSVVAIETPIEGAPKVRKSFEKLTLDEAEKWLREHRKVKAANIKILGEVQRLLTKIKPYMKPGMTVEDGLVAADLAALDAPTAVAAK